VTKSHLVSFLILGFIIICFLLYWFGIVTIDSEELIGYSFIIIGFAFFYSGIQTAKIIQTFLGSAFFLTGILLIIISTFPIPNRDKLVLPSVELITGLSLLMVFIQNKKYILILAFSVVITSIGMYSIIFASSISFTRFFNSVEKIAGGYWPILVIFLIVTFLLRRDNEK
jgi:hypothetical protein